MTEKKEKGQRVGYEREEAKQRGRWANERGTQGRVRGNERPIEEGHGGRKDKMRKFRKIDSDKETITVISN